MGEWYLETMISVLGMLTVIRVYTGYMPSQQTDIVCILSQAYVHIYINFCISLSILKYELLLKCSFLIQLSRLYSSLSLAYLQLCSLTMRNLALIIFNILTYLFNPSVIIFLVVCF